jgi:hypothetical protein
MLRRALFGRSNLRLILALAPALVLGTIAVSMSDNVASPGLRFVLLLVTISCVSMMAWRVGAAALGGSLTRAHGLPHRLGAVAGDRKHAAIDRETGLHAEWYFRLRVEEEIARAKRYDQSFTVVAVRARDGSTSDIARIPLNGSMREVDFAGSVGPTLVLCLPNTVRSGAWHLIGRITAAVDDVDLRVREYPADGPTLNALLHDGESRAA